MELLAIVAALVCAAALVAALVMLARTRQAVDERLSEVRNVIDGRLAQQLSAQQASLANQQRAVADQQRAVSEQLAQADRRLQEIRTTLDVQLKAIQVDNAAQLERMRATVDEKLQRTLSERISQSFSLVNERLAQVDRGLGEMKGLAQDVGGLKRVLANVKTRGIVGEIQLGAILKDVLAPGQYEENVEVVPGSGRRVEFAVKLPGEKGEVTWLPIDAKFPGDAYDHLRAAEEAGDVAMVGRAWRQLEERLRQEAKDIHEKYVAPPETTSFGILFLPFEGLYAEVVGRPGLIERLQRDWRVSVAGPSTMAALLNSLQMGFQTVAIQRRADEIQQVLAAVKTEFSVYQDMLTRAQRQLGTVSKTIDQLAGRRSRAMERRLRSVTELGSLEEAERVLGIGDIAEDADSDVGIGTADAALGEAGE